MSTGIETDGVDTADLEWLSLDGDEEIVWAGGPDRRTLIPAFAIGIPLAIVLIGIVIIVSEYLRVTNTHYVVTNRALYRKTGVLSRDVKRIEHEKVQDISYSQSALGTHFGYGNVEVSTAGGSGVEMAFKSVPDPKAVQRTISERVDRNRSEPADGNSSEDTLAAILTELRAIREAVDDDRSVRANGGDADGTTDRAADRSGDRAADRSGDRAADRSGDRTTDRSDDRAADRKDDRQRNEYDTDESV